MKKVKVAAVSIPNYIGELDKSISKMEKYVALAKENNVDIILFPELNLTGYITNPICRNIAIPITHPAINRIIKMAENHSLIIAFGILEKENDKVFCTHILVNQHGIIGKQRKVHVPKQESSYWACGTSINVFDIGIAKIGISICRDSFFPEYQRTLYFKGAEIVLMPFSYYNVPRKNYLNETHHGRTIQVNSWNNGFFSIFCNNSNDRPANKYEENGKKFPGWAGITDPWGHVIKYTDSEGNDEKIVITELDKNILKNRRTHPNFLAKELKPDLYKFTH